MTSISSPSVFPGPTAVPTQSVPTLWAATPAPVNLVSNLGQQIQVSHIIFDNVECPFWIVV